MTPESRDRRDPDRAVSITVNYVIVLGITAVLISGLLVGAGGYVQEQRESVVREGLSVIAEQVAAGIDDADRLAQAHPRNRSVRVGVDLPTRVGGESYRIQVTEVTAPTNQPVRHELTLRSTGTRVSVTLTISTSVDLDERSVDGGRVVVRLAGGDLVVENGDSPGTLALAEPAAGGHG
jgi:type II secretory pathway pseudopilin PulG